MANWVSHIEAHGVFGRFDLSHDLKPGVNVIFGKNGTGKTTLLHILANILNGDYARFAFLQFHTVKAVLGDGVDIQLTRRKNKKGDEVIEPIIAGKTARPIPVEDIAAMSERGRAVEPERFRRRQEEIPNEAPSPLLT